MSTTRYILTTALVLYALHGFGQSTLQFGCPEWDFGTIREENGPVSHSFEAVNRSDHPEVILEVSASCGCTKPEFSRRPILPGETASVSVSFNPAGQSGTIDRTLVVYGAGNTPVARLRITGRVEPRARTIAERYPIAVGQGIRLTNNYLPFDRLPHGRTTAAAIGIANDSDTPHEIRLIEEQQSRLLTVEAPQLLQPGEEAEIRMTYRIPADCDRYGTAADLLRIAVDGHRSDVRLTLRCIVVDAPQAAGSPAPQVRISDGAIRLGDLKRTKGPRSGPFKLGNDGTGVLTVRAVELPERVSCSLRTGMQIAPGETLSAEAGIDPSRREFGIASERILIVTDDPKRPVLRLRVTANIID